MSDSAAEDVAGAVSVVLVCGGADDVPALRRSVDSVAAQSPEPEIVIAHRGEATITRLLGRLVPGVRVVRTGRSAVRSARAEAATTASGEFVVLLRAGDRLLPDALRAGAAALTARPECAFTYGRGRSAHPGSPPLPGAGREVRSDHHVELLREDVIGPSSTVMFRRAPLLELVRQNPRADLDHDRLLYLRLTREMPAYGHGRRVAELAGAEAPRTGTGPAAADLAMLAAERASLGDNPHYLRAYRDGMESLVRLHALRLGKQAQAAGRRGVPALLAWWAAARFLLLMTRTYPRGVRALVARELLPWAARRWRAGDRLQRQLARRPIAAGTGRLDDVVRFSTRAGARILVAGTEPLEGHGRSVEHVDLLAAARDPGQFADLLAKHDHLLVPRTSYWTWDHYVPALRASVHDAYQQVWRDDVCVLYVVRGSRPTRPHGRTLVAGYFSFENAHATAGDLLVRDLVCEWLDDAGHDYDVAHAAPFRGGVDWRTVDPDAYGAVIFACGPFYREMPTWELLDRFPGARRCGVNLSMLAPLDEWNPFDVLLERDSSRTVRPDLAFAGSAAPVPVVGVCLRARAGGTVAAEAAIARMLAAERVCAVAIDTRLDGLLDGANSTGLRTPEEVESLIARMDLVVTTRLHGLVLALKNGVPAIAIDPGNEGSKIVRQAQVLGWPLAFPVSDVTDDALREAVAYCRTPRARAAAARCASSATAAAEQVRDGLLDALRSIDVARG